MARDRTLAPAAAPGQQPTTGTVASWHGRVLGWLRRRRARREAAQTLYEAAVRQARQPVFYSAWGVPDSRDGRLEMIGLHAILLMRRLRNEGREGQELAQGLFDAMFADLDRHLREWGVGDQSMGRQVKKLAQSFFGRAEALDRVLVGPDAAPLEDVLRRNVYAGAAASDPEAARRLGRYLQLQDGWLAGQDRTDLLAGRVRFVPPEAG
ncbi:MAG TPA: ubiquinol-cytochrome C chaperone family protein [Geminicoccaceae bacterium]|nr:ubiquinol-cytochrome C chaperone family protein [Geminicoccaceae bacterium]